MEFQKDVMKVVQEETLSTIEALASASSALDITPNQLKVMQNKYLRGDDPRLWMRRIARNVALAEVLYAPGVDYAQLFSGVRADVVTSDFDVRTRMFLLHKQLKSLGERSVNFMHFQENLALVASQHPVALRAVRAAEERFYSLLSSFDFLPNSPTLMNAGRDLQQLSACYVLPVSDSIEGIYDSVKHMAIIHQSGGGTGFAFSNLRPEGDHVKSTKGIASGPMSFMRIFDTSTEVVKQGGTRRGANMGILFWKHPDIRKFITAKSEDHSFLTNFNVSVAIDREFMDAVLTEREVELINPRNNQVFRKEKAAELFDLMAKCAWESGDPGFVVIDRINNSGSNTTPHIGRIESTNPCGEQPLLSYEPCNLGSINLSRFVVDGRVDYERLGQVVDVCVHFLDNVIDMNNYPLPEIELLAKGNRRIGLGVMGWAEMLVALSISYDSDEAVTLAEELMEFINTRALHMSEQMAAERGLFFHWKGSAYDPASVHFRGQDIRARNCARTTIAPTGTIAVTAGLQGSGIEPFFAIAYKRFQAEAVDALKKGEDPDEKYVYYESVPSFLAVAERQNWFGLPREKLLKQIVDNHGSVRGVAAIPAQIQDLFTSSHDISWKRHVDHQAAFQKQVDNGVSKTINMSNTVTVQDVKEAYLYAYRKGCKGVTVYRDGCKGIQVLSTGPTKKKEAVTVTAAPDEKTLVLELREEFDYSSGAQSDYYEIPTGYGILHVNIVYDEHGPSRIFVSLPPIGTEISGLASVLGIFMSKAFKSGYDPQRAIKHLNSIKGDRPHGYGPSRVDSIPHALAIALRRHLEKTKKIGVVHVAVDKDVQQPLPLEQTPKASHCAKCYSPNIKYLSGCTGPTCFDCGHAECS